MKGWTSPVTSPGLILKWVAVSKDMRERKIRLLGLQETHLPEPLQEQVTTLYQCTPTIFNSTLQENPTSSVGMVFVINNKLLCTENMQFHTLILDHAIFISFKWHPDSVLSMINVYTLNDPTKHP